MDIKNSKELEGMEKMSKVEFIGMGVNVKGGVERRGIKMSNLELRGMRVKCQR